MRRNPIPILPDQRHGQHLQDWVRMRRNPIQSFLINVMAHLQHFVSVDAGGSGT
jgi:hypothetical protein